MLHMFEAFDWAASSSNITNSSNMSGFDFPPWQYSPWVASGNTLRSGISSSVSQVCMSRIKVKKTIPNRDKLVIGFRGTVSKNSLFSFLSILCTEEDKLSAVESNGTTAISPVWSHSDVTSLPSFQLGDSNTSNTRFGLQMKGVLLTETLSDINNDALAGQLWYKDLPGNSFSTLTYYELVYDFVANKIEFWVEDVLIKIQDYVFSEQQKTPRSVYVSVAGLSSNTSPSTPAGQVGLKDFYIADERLGPVTAETVPYTSLDLEGGFLPSANASVLRQAQSIHPALSIISTTDGVMTANMPEAQEGLIFAHRTCGRYGSIEDSFLERKAKITFDHTDGTETVTSGAFDVPRYNATDFFDMMMDRSDTPMTPAESAAFKTKATLEILPYEPET